MSTLKFLTLNVRGLRNQGKRRSIFSYLKKQKANVYLLQETFSNPKDERIWLAEWGGQIFYSHGSEHSKGVCVLIKPNSPIQVEIVELDTNGRFIILRLKTPGETPGGGGDSHMKQTGMLVVSLRGINFGFLSRLRCSAQSANILSCQSLV